MATEGVIPENLKELLARTANEYNWSPKKLSNIENGLKKLNWSPEQVAHIEKTIHDEQWTSKEIIDIEKAHRQVSINRQFFSNHPNPKLGKIGDSIEIDVKINC
ncbi:hypothetical protein VNO77_12663 [Canavalia gladiata]|uniref:Uncharacterized protein n=1 Tax=Canavalia gladiata TaxID=3824 RepID=A0AAN9M056_CANGL